MKNTIKQNFEFRRLYHRGKSLASHHVVVYAMKNRRRCNRLGLTVSVKLGGAVVRNRIKRIVREAYRSQEDELKQGYDIVIVARNAAVNAKMPDIQKSLSKTFRSLGLLEERDEKNHDSHDQILP